MTDFCDLHNLHSTCWGRGAVWEKEVVAQVCPLELPQVGTRGSWV